ncbi:hypothetical protein AB0K20_22675 [Micromonospora matsumotoense]
MRTDPTVFDQSAQGTVRLRRDELPADHAEALTEAEALCPGRAITVR